MRYAFASLALALISTVAQGALLVNVSQNDSALAGHVVNDFTVDFDGIIRGQQMVLSLTSGAIYQDTFGSNTPPTDALVPAFPNVAYDSFVAMGGALASTTSPILVVGAASELDGVAQKFDTQGIDMAWAPGTGVNLADRTGFLTARITLTNDANGSARYFSSLADGTTTTIDLPVVNGVIGIPEPTTCILAGLALVGVAARRRV